MKKITLFLLLLVSIFSKAQVIPEKIENEHFKIFVGVGAMFVDGYEINKYLVQNNIQTITPVQINATTGVSFYNKDVDIDLGYEMFASGKSNETTKNRTISNGVKLRAHYVFPIAKDLEIGTGFNISYAKRKLAVYYNNYNVDFNNLPSGINGNQISLFIEKAYLGPSFSIKFKEVGRNYQQTKITFSYEFPINNKPWESSFVNLQNKIFESKNNQFIVNVIFDL
jgi:hypothetical protein